MVWRSIRPGPEKASHRYITFELSCAPPRDLCKDTPPAARSNQRQWRVRMSEELCSLSTHFTLVKPLVHTFRLLTDASNPFGRRLYRHLFCVSVSGLSDPPNGVKRLLFHSS